jgi:predicted lipid carrier protein YhbT
VYVRPGSDAEAHVRKRFSHKVPRHVGSVLRPGSARGFLDGLRLTFQRQKAAHLGVDARWHFRFYGDERLEATVDIHGGELTVRRSLEDEPDVTVEADAATWVGYLRGERSLLWAILMRRIRIRGPKRLMGLFARCFAR